MVEIGPELIAPEPMLVDSRPPLGRPGLCRATSARFRASYGRLRCRTLCRPWPARSSISTAFGRNNGAQGSQGWAFVSGSRCDHGSRCPRSRSDAADRLGTSKIGCMATVSARKAVNPQTPNLELSCLGPDPGDRRSSRPWTDVVLDTLYLSYPPDTPKRSPRNVAPCDGSGWS